MAAPGIPPTRLIAAIHDSDEGETRDGWRTDTRTVDPNPQATCALWTMTLTEVATAEHWDALYREQADGKPGRIQMITNSVAESYRKALIDDWQAL
jgi:hypothetical protein